MSNTITPTVFYRTLNVEEFGGRPLSVNSMQPHSSLLTPVMRERVPVNCRSISQNFSPAGVTSPL